MSCVTPCPYAKPAFPTDVFARPCACVGSQAPEPETGPESAGRPTMGFDGKFD